MTNFDTIYQQVSQDYYKLKQIESQFTTNKQHIQQLTNQLQQHQHTLQLLQQTSTVFKTLQEKLTTTHIDHITTLINNALATVFNTPTTQYHIRIETTQQRNNNVTQFYLLTTQDDTTTETLLQDNGFGIQSLIGFVLQIYFIIQHNQAHILFLDESLTAISTDKLPKLKLFINEVSKQYNFHFILIAHMESLFQLADYSYSVHNGKVTPIPVNNS